MPGPFQVFTFFLVLVTLCSFRFPNYPFLRLALLLWPSPLSSEHTHKFSWPQLSRFSSQILVVPTFSELSRKFSRKQTRALSSWWISQAQFKQRDLCCLNLEGQGRWPSRCSLPSGGIDPDLQRLLVKKTCALCLLWALLNPGQGTQAWWP